MSIEKRREYLRNLIKKEGIYNVSELTGMKVHEVASVSQLQFDYKLASEIIYSLVDDDKVKKNYEGFEISIDMMSGTFDWTRKKTTDFYGPKLKETIGLLATPFWENQNNVPIDITYYEVKTLNGLTFYEEHPDIFDSIEPAKGWYRSVDDLINWFNESYLPSVYQVLVKHLPRIRERAKHEIERKFDRL